MAGCGVVILILVAIAIRLHLARTKSSGNSLVQAHEKYGAPELRTADKTEINLAYTQ